MAGLLDLFRGGGGKDDDPYADILTPGQRNQMLTQGLLAMAGAFADAGMPSRLPIPFGSALGKAAAALGTGQDAAMTSALAGAYRAQQIRDLRAKAALQAKLNPLFQQVLDQARGGGGAMTTTLPLPGPGARPAGPGASPGSGAAPAAATDVPLTMDLPYPAAGGGLLGGGDTDLTGGLPGNVPSGGSGVDTDLLTGGGLLASAPAAAAPAAPTTPPTNKQAWGVATPEEREAWIKSRQAGGQDTIQAFVMKYRLRPRTTEGSGGGLLGEGFGGGSSPADLGAGGDDAIPVRGPTSAPPWAADPLNRGLRGDTTGQSAMDRFRSDVFGGGSAEDLYSSLTPRPAGGAARGETPEMTRLIEQAAAQQRVSPDVLRGLLKTESGFRSNAVSPAGAVGVAQLMPATARGLGVTDPTDPAQAIPAGARYLREGLDASGGDLTKALMYYHGGPDQSRWGPRTQAYPGAVLAAAGGSGGSTEPDPYANLTPTPGGQPPAAPSTLPGLAAPSTLPPLAPPGAALGSGGKIPGLNMSPQELAVIDAMAEAAGLGNPFKGLLDTYYKSPGYLQESAGATAKGREAVEFPNRQQLQNEKARSDLLQQMAKDALTLDEKGNVVEIPEMRGMLGKTAEEIEAGKERAKAQFTTVEAPVLGPNWQPTTEKMTAYEFSYRRQQRAANAALGAPPQPGDIIGMPALTGSPPEGYRYNVSPQGTVTAQPIPGTPADEAVKERNRKQAVSDQATLVSRDIMVQNANRVEDLVANSTLPVTGTAGPFLSRIGGTAANDVRVMIETMKARSSLDQLNQMRNSNPTGAGLGNVSNAEGDRLAAAIANLDQSQTQDQFLFNLRRLKQEYVDIVHGPGTYSKLSDEPVLKVPSMPSGNQPIDRPTYDKLPSGSPFTAPDGSRRIKP